MKRSIKHLLGYTIEVKDGTKGTVKDFLFDETNWIVRYLDADLGFILPGKRVILPKMFWKKPLWDKKHFPVELTKEEVKNSPELDENKPISRIYEEKLNVYYKIKNYWSDMPPYGANVGVTLPPRPVAAPKSIVKEENVDTSLRSFKEVKGYNVETKDDTLGHIEDFIIDDNDWQIVYAILDTKDWLPWSKKVMIPINHLKEIHYLGKKVIVNLTKETIKNAPEYNSSEPISAEYEKKVINYLKEHAV